MTVGNPSGGYDDDGPGVSTVIGCEITSDSSSGGASWLLSHKSSRAT